MLCYYAECHYAEWRILFNIMMNAVMLRVIMLDVVMLSVEAQPTGVIFQKLNFLSNFQMGLIS